MMVIVREEKGVMSCVGGGVGCEGASSSHTYSVHLGRRHPLSLVPLEGTRERTGYSVPLCPLEGPP